MAEIRPAADVDVESWVDLHNRIEPRLPLMVEAVREWRPREPTLTDLFAFDRGRPIGVGRVFEAGDLRGGEVAAAFFGVLADERHRGAGGALYRAVSEHARTLEKNELQVETWADEEEGLRFLTRRGFREVERYDCVRLDLERASAPAPAPPAGVELVTRERRPDLVDAMYEVACEAWPDMPSEDPLGASYEDWRGFEILHPSRRADLTFLAVADGEVVGYASAYAVPGGEDAWHLMTAVKRAWRRRGVATALKQAQIAAAKSAGFRGLVTFNEMRNAPMRALNARLGYRPLPAQIRLRGPLAAIGRKS